MSEKISVSKPSFNVLTTTEPNNIIYSSDYNSLKYYNSGSLNLIANKASYYGTSFDPIAGSTVYLNITANTIPHNLGYTPFYTGFVDTEFLGFSMLPLSFADAGAFSDVSGWADGTNLYFQYWFNSFTDTGFATATVLYKIFRNDTGL